MDLLILIFEKYAYTENRYITLLRINKWFRMVIHNNPHLSKNISINGNNIKIYYRHKCPYFITIYGLEIMKSIKWLGHFNTLH